MARCHKEPLLAPAPSAQLRDQLIAEIHELNDGESLALWAHRRLTAKNTLISEDARAVEPAYQAMLSESPSPPETDRKPLLGPASLNLNSQRTNYDVVWSRPTSGDQAAIHQQRGDVSDSKEHPQTQQGPSGVCREPALSGVPALAL